LVGGATERFRVAGFEAHDGGRGAVFLGDIFVLLLEVEHGGVYSCVWNRVKWNK